MFLGLASKQGWRFFSWFDLKTDGFGFFWFGPQNRQLWFDDLDIKINVTVF
jgi:hypothetical protein